MTPQRAWHGRVLAALLAGTMLRPAAAVEPTGWLAVPINDRKPRTVYDGGRDGDVATVRASADRSASLLVKPGTGIDLAVTPMVTWRWQLLKSPNSPDIAIAAREDAAARLVFVFDGDRARLPRSDRVVMAAADRLGSRPMPYATLMYVTSGSHPVGSVVANPYTRRVRMLVVDNLPADAQRGWRTFRRDLAADFRQVFGEAPGTLIAFGLMTDSDNTRSRAEAVYTEPQFAPGR